MFFKYKNFSLDGGAATSAVLVDGGITTIRDNGGAEKVVVSSVLAVPVAGAVRALNAKAACCLTSIKDVCLASADTIKIN